MARSNVRMFCKCVMALVIVSLGSVDAATSMAHADHLHDDGPISTQQQFNYYSLGPLVNRSPIPFMHNLMFRLRDMPALFSAGEISNEHPVASLDKINNDPSFRGAFVGLPLRESIIQYILSVGGSLSPMAKMSHSVNTVLKRQNGELVGHNTEVDAIQITLWELMNRLGGQNTNSVLVVGTGGAARGAVTAALTTEGVERVSLIGRDEERVQALLEEYPLLPYTEEAQFSVIIACVDPETQNELMEKYPVLFSSGRRDGHVPAVIDVAYWRQPTPMVQWAVRLQTHTEPMDAIEKYKTDQQLLYVMPSVVAHELWTQHLIADGEITETALTKAEVDVPVLIAKISMLVSNLP